MTKINTYKQKQNGIMEMSQKALAQGAIDMAFGHCHLPVPHFIRTRAHKALEQERANTYAPATGVALLREAIRDKLATHNKIPMEENKYDCMVTNGATGALTCSFKALFRPGDEILVFSPFYPPYLRMLRANGITVKTVPIALNDLSIDLDQFKKAITAHTKGILLCNPHNPCGKVFTRSELLALGTLAREHSLFIIADEVYEHITYPGHPHISLASLEDFMDRTITVFSFSKAYNITGWRLGYVAGPAAIIRQIAFIHSSIFYVCAPTPLQHAALAVFPLNKAYHAAMRQDYLQKRDFLLDNLTDLRFHVTVPQGACYLLADFGDLPWQDDEIAVSEILQKMRVAVSPGSVFYLDPTAGRSIVRFCYALEFAQIKKAIKQMSELKEIVIS